MLTLGAGEERAKLVSKDASCLRSVLSVRDVNAALLIGPVSWMGAQSKTVYENANPCLLLASGLFVDSFYT
jgi:hypothetical protein